MPKQAIIYQSLTGLMLFGFLMLGMYLEYQAQTIEHFRWLLSLSLSELSNVEIGT